jgi:hypothetical protein
MPGIDKIGEWDSTTLVKFIQDTLQNNPSSFTPSVSVDYLLVASKALIQDQIQFGRGRPTVGSAGSAQALPATPAGYIEILDYTGQMKLIPYYNAT